MMGALYNNVYQFVQTDDYVMILVEMVHDARIIPIVEDSNIYSLTWTAELSFYNSSVPWYEYACHEGNYSMPGSLAGARRLEMEEAGLLEQ